MAEPNQSPARYPGSRQVARGNRRP